MNAAKNWELTIMIIALAFVHFSSERIQWNRLFFTDCFLAKFPPEIPGEISRFFCEFWLFSCENPAKLADFSANFPLKIPRNFAFFPQNIRSPVYRGGSRGRVQGVRTPPRHDLRFSNTTGILRKKTMWFISVEVEKETSAPPPKKKSWIRPWFIMCTSC